MGEQMQKPSMEREEVNQATDETLSAAPESADRAEKLKADLDGLLDEIDDVLETNAEQFVRSYVQKGGQ